MLNTLKLPILESMKLFTSVGDYFALDIGTSAVRVVKLRSSGANWTLENYALTPITEKLSSSDAPEDQHKLGEVITATVAQSGIKTRDVVIGAPSQRTFITIVDMPTMNQQELAATIKYQAEQYIPMTLDEAKVDWALLGSSPVDPAKNEVLIASVPNTFSEGRLDLVESLGFNVIAIEPDGVALARALSQRGSQDAKIIVELGETSTDIVAIYADMPRLVRSVPMGLQTFTKAIAQNLNATPEQAEQFIIKFGLYQDKLEGQIFRAMEATLDQFMSEVSKSVKFFQTRYQAAQQCTIVASDFAATVPAFAEHMANKLTLPVERGNAWRSVNVPGQFRQQLQPVAAQFSVAVGLAQRGGEE